MISIMLLNGENRRVTNAASFHVSNKRRKWKSTVSFLIIFMIFDFFSFLHQIEPENTTS